MKINILVLFLVFLSLASVQAQVGGRTVYNFLELPSTARMTALGSRLISVSDDDGALAYHNPAVLSDSAHGQISFNYNFLYGNGKHGLLSYAHHLDRADITLGAQIKFIGYGDLVETDVFGTELGVFSPSELAINFSASKALYERLTIGANLKYIQSSIGVFTSTGIGLDLGAYYEVTESGLSMALVVNHLGAQLTTYDQERETLPTNVQFGLSKRLKYMPFRFSITAHHLNRWNLRYDNPFDDRGTFTLGETPNTEPDNGSALDNVFRHLIFSGEFLLGKKENFRIRLAYNHMLRQDLKIISNATSFTGLSFGFGLKVSKFRFDYGRGVYHVAGGTHHITLSTALSSFGAKR